MIGPSDIRVAFSQIPETERIQKVQQQHPDLSQRQFALQLHEQEEQKKSQVEDAERTEKEKITDEERKNRHSNEQRQKLLKLKKEGEEENEKGGDRPIKGRFIDIQI